MGKIRMVRLCGFLIGIAAMAFFVVGTWPGHADSQAIPPLTKIEELGKRVFFDNISVPKRMSCSTCHDPAAGWTFKNSGVNQHQVAVTGADPHTAGTLKPPSNAYASFIPKFQPCGAGFFGLCGGNFWNGRSEGNDPPLFAGAAGHVGDEVFKVGGSLDPALQAAYEAYLGPVADQALNPFGNPVEQNIEREGVCRHVERAKYAPLFGIVWKESIDCSPDGLDKSFKRIAVSLSAWQASSEVNSFSSKRDKELAAGGTFPLAGFTDQENLGHDLFYGTNESGLNNGGPGGTPKNAGCTVCHLSDLLKPDGTGKEERYTDDGYHNIGTPPNPEIPGYPVPNAGLAGHTVVAIDPPVIPGPATFLPLGFHKTPTLRNVDKRPGKGFTKAYTHNGWFKSMESIVHFYNTAAMQEDLDALPPFIPPDSPLRVKKHDVTRCDPSFTWTEKEALKQNCWPAPEVVGPGIAIGLLVGNLGMTSDEEAAIVAYLKTFTDTYTPKQPAPYK